MKLGRTVRRSAALLLAVVGIASGTGASAATARGGQTASTTWTQQSPATNPSGRAGASMAYDAATSQLLLFGGATSGVASVNETWGWNAS